ncbi:hypothetical protein LA080_008128 [Diaporthe eres]|nr:hypothetical protein LA080_008128 [Diaporthe eres]
MVQSRPVATLATVICDRNNAIAGKERERDRSGGSTARAAVGLQATGPELRAWGGGGSSHRKKSIFIGLQFSRSWSQRSSRRASEAITPSTLSPPDMAQHTGAAEESKNCMSAIWVSSGPTGLWAPTVLDVLLCFVELEVSSRSDKIVKGDSPFRGGYAGGTEGAARGKFDSGQRPWLATRRARDEAEAKADESRNAIGEGTSVFPGNVKTMP